MPRRLTLLAVAMLAVGACAPPASPSGSAGPSGSPAPTGSPPGAIDHPTGATDVVLRFEEGGGFVPVEFTATNVPIFTLYGDGTILFRDPMDQPAADHNGLLRYQPLKAARLSQDQIQELLGFAIGPGGLGVARDLYPDDHLADGGTAIFTLRAGGQEKTVSIVGLVEGGVEGPDAGARRDFLALADRLRNFDEDGRYPTVPYEPVAYRGVLMETSGVVVPLHAWPWTTIGPGDFVAPKDPNAPFQLPSRSLSPDELAALDLGDLRGGALGIYLQDADGKQWSLSIRPLLPDDKS